MVTGKGETGRFLSEEEARQILKQGLEPVNLEGKRVLVIIPDGTRSGPMGLFFRLFHELLGTRTAALDYLIALGTHQPMSEAAIRRLLGVSAEAMAARYAGVRVFNHRWNDREALRTLGVIPAAETAVLSDGRLAEDVPVTVNNMIFDYDQIIVCGPVFPHEVVGFSGGNKYFFPGISGPEVINFTHWLGALVTCYATIGIKHTPTRAIVHRAAAMIDVPKLCCCMVVQGDKLAGLYVGSPEEAWSQAADLSAEVHIRWVDRPYRRVLSVMPELYDDIWTAAKGMYKLEPVVADGGEVILYAPHITELSYTHGHILDEIGYHVLDYFTKQWNRFQKTPRSVLAHSTHLRGIGSYDAGIEKPRIQVTLATGIPRERCERVALGYCDPLAIDLEEWRGREDDGILLVPHAGEILYRLNSQRQG